MNKFSNDGSYDRSTQPEGLIIPIITRKSDQRKCRVKFIMFYNEVTFCDLLLQFLIGDCLV